MGGGPVRNMNMLVWGVDLVEEQLLCTAGIPSKPPVASKPLMNIAEYSINAMKSGIIRDFDFLQQYQGRPDVLYARAIVAPGSKVVCVADGLPTWICEAMVSKPTVDEAIQVRLGSVVMYTASLPLSTCPYPFSAMFLCFLCPMQYIKEIETAIQMAVVID
jgi:hypothetical protein